MQPFIKFVAVMLCTICFLSGCSSDQRKLNSNTDIHITETTISDSVIAKPSNATPTENAVEGQISNSLQIDLTDYFQGINGSVVIYDKSKMEYSIHNQELSEKRSSPCSTFKIVSALIGLNENILESKDTLIKWNGTNYLIDEWNQNLTLKQAFQSSCPWYFRNVIDKAGKEAVNRTLAELSYGNTDTSQWEGSNTNKNYNELNGFWLESSLMISPKEQVDTLIRIFSAGNYDGSHIKALKDIMKIDNAGGLFSVYGKTGTGYRDDRCIDAWFVGIAESEGKTYYFAVRLDEPDNDMVSGQKAKEIGLNIINKFLQYN